MDNTERVSVRLRLSVKEAVDAAAAKAGIDAATFMANAIRDAVKQDLPPEEQAEIDLSEALYSAVKVKATTLDDQGFFDEHFILTVMRHLSTDEDTAPLYRKAIGTDDVTATTPKKMPLNMYLGWFIKNAVGAKTQVDSDGKLRRAFVKGEAIKSYTLLERDDD